MSDHKHPKEKRDGPRGRDFASQMARAEFGRHYVDSERVEQTLYYGEIVFRHRKPVRGERS